MTKAKTNHKLQDLNKIEDMLDKLREHDRAPVDTSMNSIEQLGTVLGVDILRTMEDTGFDGENEQPIFFTLSHVFPVVFGVAQKAELKDPVIVSELATSVAQTVLLYTMKQDINPEAVEAYLNITIGDLSK